MGKFALQTSPCNFLILRLSPWEVLIPFLVCFSSLSALSLPCHILSSFSTKQRSFSLFPLPLLFWAGTEQRQQLWAARAGVARRQPREQAAPGRQATARCSARRERARAARRVARLSERRRRRRQRLARDAAGAAQTGVEARGRERRPGEREQGPERRAAQQGRACAGTARGLASPGGARAGERRRGGWRRQAGTGADAGASRRWSGGLVSRCGRRVEQQAGAGAGAASVARWLGRKAVWALTQAHGWSSHAGRATRRARAAQLEHGHREPARVRQMRAHGWSSACAAEKSGRWSIDAQE
jgi:hypothetical protein